MLRLARSLVVPLLASLLACGGAGSPGAAPGTQASGADVSFSLPSSSGELVTVPVAGARHTVLDFFGPTCEPCAKKVPELVGRRGDIEKRGGRLVLVAVLADGESTADAERALTKWGVRSPFLVDRAGVSLREAGVKDLPSTLILDSTGATRWRAPIGATADDVLRALP
jgi:hypothetical protein